MKKFFIIFTIFIILICYSSFSWASTSFIVDMSLINSKIQDTIYDRTFSTIDLSSYFPDNTDLTNYTNYLFMYYATNYLLCFVSESPFWLHTQSGTKYIEYGANTYFGKFTLGSSSDNNNTLTPNFRFYQRW